MEAPVIRLARTPSRKIAGTSIADKIRLLVAPPGSTLGIHVDAIPGFVRSLITTLKLSDSITIVMGDKDPAPEGTELAGVIVNVGMPGVLAGHASCFTRINNAWYYMDSDTGVKQTTKFTNAEFVERTNSGKPLIEMANPITGQTMVSDKTGDRIRFYVKKTTEPATTFGSWALSFFYDNASIPLSTYSGNYIPSQSGATCVFDSVNNILFLADGIRSKTYDLLRSSGLDQRIRASPTLEDAAFDAFVEAEVNHSEWPALTVTTSEEDKKMLRVFILMALRMYDIEQVESSHSNADKSKRVLDFYLERNPGLEMMLRSLKAVSPRFRSLNVSDRTKVSDADVAKRTGMGDTLLHLAALFDIPAWIGPLVTRGLDINAANAMGSAPLHFAVELGHVDFIKELFKHGVNPNVVDNIDFSPRRVAIERNRLDLLKLLDANGADKTEFLPSSDPYKPPIPMDYYVSVLISRGRVELKPILEYLKSQNSPSSKNRRRVSRKNRKNIRRTRRH